MKVLIAALLMLICVGGAAAQERNFYNPKASYSVFAEYSNDSSHMIIGESANRKLFAAGVDYNRRLVGRSIFSWKYQVEVVPLELLRNPRLMRTTTFTVTGNPAFGTIPAGTFQSSALQARQCRSLSGSGNFYEPGSDGQLTVVGSYTFTSICTNPWTYGGGVSPLGQKVNFLPHSKIQPYVAMNAGFVAFAKTIPSDTATMFNFSFEFGGGVEWNSRSGGTWGVDYRYHHVSNAGRGMTNPGVDNGTFRVTHTFRR
jgi:hypothetical protein